MAGAGVKRPLFELFEAVGLPLHFRDTNPKKKEAEERRQAKRRLEVEGSPAKELFAAKLLSTPKKTAVWVRETKAIPLNKVSKVIKKAKAMTVVIPKNVDVDVDEDKVKYRKDGSVDGRSLKGGILEPYDIIVCDGGKNEAYIRGEEYWLYNDGLWVKSDLSELNASELHQVKGMLYATWSADGKPTKISGKGAMGLVYTYTDNEEIRPKLSEMVGLNVVNFKTGKSFRIQAVDKKTGSIRVAPCQLSDVPHVVKSPVFERKLVMKDYNLEELVAVWAKMEWKESK